MKLRRLRPAAWLACALVLAAAGCGKDDDPAAPAVDAVPDFAALDVNPTSATYATDVSPRDYLQKVSAWYFGHAT